MAKTQEVCDEIKLISGTESLNYNLLKLKNKIIANNLTINLNKLHIFTMDTLPI